MFDNVLRNGIRITHEAYDDVDLFLVFPGKRGLPDWRLLRTLCMPNATYELIESTNLMKVVFHTDYYVSKTGFKANINIGKHLVNNYCFSPS
jgi:hypothetical protein